MAIKQLIFGLIWSLGIITHCAAQCPVPTLLPIGDDQCAFMIKSPEGSNSNPIYRKLTLIAEVDGAYKEVMSVKVAEKASTDENSSSWNCEFSAPPGNKRFFRDVIVTMKGNYSAEDFESLPVEVKPHAKSNKNGRFTLAKRYVYKEGKGYQFRGPAGVIID